MKDRNTTTPHRVPAQLSTEGLTFFVEALKDIRTTGAIASSSRGLADLLTGQLRESAGQPLTVLEAGAGTGSVTRALLPLLDSGSRLDIVEANPRFAARLHHLVSTRPDPADGSGEVRVHETLVEHLDPGHRYDAIVSGLPFANFTPAQVELIMGRYLELLRPGGTLTYFAYLGTRHARRLLGSRREVARHRAVERVLASYQRRYATGRWAVWGNLPPAHVWQLQAPRRATVPGQLVPHG